jgi:hypothetical protein
MERAMQRSDRSSYTSLDFVGFHERKALVLVPKFQRRGVWKKPAQSYLIETTIAKRAGKYVSSGSHENVIISNASRISNFAAVRHRIAHASVHARTEFGKATMILAGRRYRGASPGRFLRDINPQSMPQARWLQTIGVELKNLARQIV